MLKLLPPQPKFYRDLAGLLAIGEDKLDQFVNTTAQLASQVGLGRAEVDRDTMSKLSSLLRTTDVSTASAVALFFTLSAAIQKEGVDPVLAEVLVEHPFTEKPELAAETRRFLNTLLARASIVASAMEAAAHLTAIFPSFSRIVYASDLRLEVTSSDDEEQAPTLKALHAVGLIQIKTLGPEPESEETFSFQVSLVQLEKLEKELSKLRDELKLLQTISARIASHAQG